MSSSAQMVISPLGDQAVTLSWPDVTDADFPALLLAVRRALEVAELVGVRAVVPGYETLTVHYDPRLWRFADVVAWVDDACALATAVPLTEQALIEIPVCYDPEFGIDLADVAAHCGLTCQQVIALHSGAEYTVRMIGFAPGFPYLAGLPKELHTPRLSTPRVKVPRGAVAIGGAQTGIYSVDSPGGWRLIGQTPLKLFDASRAAPSLLQAGDRVRFRAISRGELEAFLGGMPTALRGHVSEELAPDSCPPRAVGMAPTRSGRGTQATIAVLRGHTGMTVQERARWNSLGVGVPVSGAIDFAAQRVANLLVANDPEAAVLEVTLAFGELEFRREALIAVTGADLGATVDGNPLPLGRPVALRAGAKLSFGSARAGCRAYMAVAGGIDTPEVLGSRSTDVRSQLGGVSGRALQAGDELPVGEPSELAVRLMQRLESEASFAAPRWFVPGCELDAIEAPPLRFLRGAQFEWLTSESQQALVTKPFQILPASDRTGLRLRGPSLTFHTQRELASTGVAVGTVQLPPSGDPLVLLNDGPPTGGYAQVAHIISADLPKLAQQRPGQAVRLREVTIAEVESLRSSQWQEEIQQELGINLALRELVR